jgi:hypothetical protein
MPHKQVKSFAVGANGAWLKFEFPGGVARWRLRRPRSFCNGLG